MRITLVILVCLSSILFAEDILFKDGKIYKNVKILSIDSEKITIVFNNEEGSIPISIIDKVIEDIFDPSQPSRILTPGHQNNSRLTELEKKNSLSKDELKEYLELKKESPTQTLFIKQKEYKRLGLLALGIPAFIGTYHFLKKSSDQSDAIEVFKGFGDTSELEREKNMNLIWGIICGAAGITFTLLALTPVEIQVKRNTLSVRVNF